MNDESTQEGIQPELSPREKLDKIDTKDPQQVGQWIKEVSVRPPEGHDPYREAGDTPVSLEDQFNSFIQNTTDILTFRRARGTDEEKIKELLWYMTEPFTKTIEEMDEFTRRDKTDDGSLLSYDNSSKK